MDDAGALAVVSMIVALLGVIASIVFGVIKITRLASDRDVTLTGVGDRLSTRISETAREIEGKLGEESRALRASLDEMGRSMARLETTMQEAVLPRLTHLEKSQDVLRERVLRIETMKWREMAGHGAGGGHGGD